MTTLELFAQGNTYKAETAAIILGISRRKLLAEIAELNRNGIFILSSGSGFRLLTTKDEDREELKHCRNKLVAMIRSIADRVAVIDRTTRKEVMKQLTLEFE